MKILLVCHRLPYPPNRGGKIRSFNMIKHLGEKHSVVVASLAQTEQEQKEGAGLSKYCEEVIVEVVPNAIRWSNACRALLTSTPSSVAYFWSRRLARRIKKKIVETRFDAILVHCAFVAQYVMDCRYGLRILDYGDMDSVKWAEYADFKAFPLSQGYALEARKLRDYEKRVAGHFHRCTVTTQAEKEQFESLGTATPCDVVPNGVDTTYFYRNGNSAGKRPAIVFLGRMDYFPNIDAVCYFAEKIFPLIQRRVPDVEFRIVGSNPPAHVRDLAKNPEIVVTGHVSDVRPYLKDAAISVAPLRIARGTQNKILESMAMGIPVVTTPQAAKGIQALPGRDFLVASEPAAFAQCVTDAMQNDKLWHDLATAAQTQIEKVHLWSASMKVLDGLMELPATESSARVRTL
jgi:sugar transferase (PEP-CTERM/EpsH1 system associated)